MREILFRGRRIYDQKLVFGNLITDEHGQVSIIPFENIEADGHHLRIDSDESVFIELETVGQFTGLTDKNGTKIFEGDKLHCTSGECIYGRYECDVKGIVEYSGCAFLLNSDNIYLNALENAEEIEVIGNIHDNPELC